MQRTWGDTYKAFSAELLRGAEKITKQGETILTKACESWLKEQDSNWPRHHLKQSGASFGGDRYYPWYTGNLHDSLATRVANNNRTISIRQMQPAATVAQSNGITHERVVGNYFGRMAAVRAAGAGAGYRGLQAQLFIGVPYAEKVNEMDTHEGYVEMMQDDFYTYVSSRLRELQNLVIRTS